MITVDDIQKIISVWQQRMNSPIQPFSYKNALSECIYDLNQLVSRSINEDLSYQEYLMVEADNYLSSIEAHEQAV